jgi:hypothetical protein
LTRITAAEVADDASWEDIASGPGNVNSAELFIQGSEAQARRMSNQEKGLSFDNTTGIDLSAADTLIGWWVLALQPPAIGTSTNQDLEVRVTSDTSPTTSADGWNVLDSSNYPPLGGFVRIWVAVNEITPDRSGSPTYTSLRHFGINCHFTTVSGNAPNLICDAIDYLDGGGAALVIDAGTGGAPAVFADLVAADEGTNANKYGVWQSRAGVLYCAVRTQIADATLTVFNDSGFVVVFPLQTGTASQNLINSDSNGITIDLQTSGTLVDWADGVLRSEDSANTPGDLQVTGSTGAFAATGMRLEGLRVVDLTSACSITASVFFECGLITAAGADLGECTFQLGTGAVAVGWDTATNPGSTGGELDNTTFISDGTGHGIEFGTTSPLTIDLNDMTFTGYAGSDGSTGNEAIWFRRSSGTITLNINGGTTPSVRTDGAIIDKVINPVTLTINVKALSDGSNIEDANVIVRPLDGTGPLPFEDVVTITRVSTTATVAHTAHGLATNELVEIRGADQDEYNGVQTITVTSVNEYTYTVSGSPTTPATGTITGTAVIIKGLTNASGIISNTRAYGSDQPIVGWARKSSASPYFRTGAIAGDISSAAGLSVTVQLATDE